MDNYSLSVLNSDEILAIKNAYHSDVFSVLGIHKHPEKEGLLVRAFLPHAISVSVIDTKTKKKVAVLKQIDDAGLFEGKLGNRRNFFAYQLVVTYDSGEITIDDPYCFPSLINEKDMYLFCEGTHENTYQWMGSHELDLNGINGTHFVLWAPEASRVSVVGDFNFWNGASHVMRKHLGSGIWEIFLPNVVSDANYKYEILDKHGQLQPLKADPYAFSMQHPPNKHLKLCLIIRINGMINHG